MSDASNRAERCRDLARVCRRLAAISSSTEMRTHYSRMAEHYSGRETLVDQARVHACAEAARTQRKDTKVRQSGF
jgi:hypothetical protein